jgi:hypothetical protein
MQLRMLLSIAGLALFMLLGGMPLFAQTQTGCLTGTIYDQAGARLEQAAVVVKNATMGTDSAMHPNEKGEYRFENLPVGKYSIRAAARGLTTVQINDIFVQANKTSIINVTLPESQSSPISVVEVSEAPEPIETAPAPVPVPVVPPQESAEDAKTIDPKAAVREIIGIRDRLALSAGQQLKIHAVFQARQMQIAAVRSDTSLPVAARREKIKAIRADAEAKFRALLNENQTDEYDEILRERREHALQKKQEMATADGPH